MAKDFAHMTHAERMTALVQELHSPSSVAKADKMLELISHEWRDIYGMRESAAIRHGVTDSAPSVPAPAPPVKPEAPAEAPQVSPERIRLVAERTITDLVDLYRAHKNFTELRYKTRVGYSERIARIVRDAGHLKLADLKTQDIQRLYDGWTENGTIKLPQGHGLITTLRVMLNYGMAELGDSECERLCMVLHKMRFKLVKPRTQLLTETQAMMIIEKANAMGLHSIALAQAFQLDCNLGQKDVIGEWVPVADPGGDSDVKKDGLKWLRGLRWEEIDADYVLRHVASNGGALKELPLRKAQTVMQQFARLGELPKRGPIIVRELTEFPWQSYEFRRQWRIVARRCGIPDEVRNMDGSRGSRANVRAGRKRAARSDSEPSPKVEEPDLALTTRH